MRIALAALALLAALTAGIVTPALAHGGAGGGLLQYTPPYSSLCSPSPIPCPDYGNSKK